MSGRSSCKMRRNYHNGYANLAAAIIVSGNKCNDKSFLESNWCEVLQEMCRLDDEMYGDRDGIPHSGKVPRSTTPYKLD